MKTLRRSVQTEIVTKVAGKMKVKVKILFMRIFLSRNDSAWRTKVNVIPFVVDFQRQLAHNQRLEEKQTDARLAWAVNGIPATRFYVGSRTNSMQIWKLLRLRCVLPVSAHSSVASRARICASRRRFPLFALVLWPGL